MKKLLLIIILWAIPTLSFAVTTFYWTPPTTNMDGSPLTDLAGYKFYCGNAPATYTEGIDIGLPSIPEYLIENVLGQVDGDFYCAMTAYDDNGNESILSNEVNFPFDNAPPAAVGGVGVR